MSNEIPFPLGPVIVVNKSGDPLFKKTSLSNIVSLFSFPLADAPPYTILLWLIETDPSLLIGKIRSCRGPDETLYNSRGSQSIDSRF